LKPSSDACALVEAFPLLQPWNRIFRYDAVGNRLSSLGVASYTNNVSNELTATSHATYGYDLNGNAISKNDSSRSKGATRFESINVQIVPDHNLAVVGLTDLLQQLIFASCFSALRCPRLISRL
jgi:hypothetical protein